MVRPKTLTVSASHFKAECLALIHCGEQTGDEIVVIKNNRPVAKLVAIGSRSGPFPPFAGRFRGMSQVIDDAAVPLTVM